VYQHPCTGLLVNAKHEPYSQEIVKDSGLAHGLELLCTCNVEDLRGTTASFKEQNAALLAQLMPQDDMLDMPLQQASFDRQMTYTVPAPEGPHCNMP